MARNLLETITERAKETAPFDMANVDFAKIENLWLAHWFDTADKFKQELVTEGLCASAAHVDKLIDQQRRFTTPRNLG